MTYRTIITRNRTLEGNIEPDKCDKIKLGKGSEVI